MEKTITLLKNVLAIIGGLTVFFLFLESLFNILPKLNSLRSNFWKFLSSKIKHKQLEKRAIASNIENVLNEVVIDLKKELPAGWISKASIKWVEKEVPHEIEDGELILRMKPLENQDQNLMNGVFLFFTRTLFPNTKEIIPATVRKASILYLSRRTISKKQPYIVKNFEKDFIETSITLNPSIAKYIGDYANIDERGYFTGTYLREINKVADVVRYTEIRSEIEDEFKNILEHIKTFMQYYLSSDMPDELWYSKGKANSYAFLLVAQPHHQSINQYLKRAQRHYTNGIERLYVIGANQEKRFVERVIKGIADKTKYKLLELFELHKDYRGEPGGIGALFDAEALEKESKEIIDDFLKEKAES